MTDFLPKEFFDSDMKLTFTTDKFGLFVTMTLDGKTAEFGVGLGVSLEWVLKYVVEHFEEMSE